jgi:hypothetical protein
MKTKTHFSGWWVTLTFAVMTAGAATALAKSNLREFKVEGATVKMDIPKDWQSAENLFGMPLTILGPHSEKDGRPVIGVVPTGIKDVMVDAKTSVEAEAHYRLGREAYLKNSDGKALSFDPVKVEQIAGAEDAISMGYTYQLFEKKFSEKSYYITCDKQLFHVKTLVGAGSQEKKFKSVLENAVKSFACK